MTPYTRGFEAYTNGLKLNQNPYSRSELGYYEWINGWSAAQSKGARNE